MLTRPFVVATLKSTFATTSKSPTTSTSRTSGRSSRSGGRTIRNATMAMTVAAPRETNTVHGAPASSAATSVSVK